MGRAIEELFAVVAPARGPTRRELLALAATSVPLLAIGCRGSRSVATRPIDAGASFARAAPHPPAGRVLTADEWRVYEAAVARILPSDDGAGAREADVITFLDRQLATRLFQPLVPVFRNGALLLDRWARRTKGRGFADLGDADADAILDTLSRGAIPVVAFPERELFGALHELTLEGFLSDPVHGGNAGQCGWRYVDFPEPQRRRPGPVDGHGGHEAHAAPGDGGG